MFLPFSMVRAAESSVPLIENIKQEIIDPIIFLFMSLAVLYFVWGLVAFIRNADSDEARSTGRKHMIYGVIGIFIMIAAFGIINLIYSTFNIPNS